MRSAFLQLFALAFLIATVSRSAVAQIGQAELTGDVRDPTGAVIPRAQVTVTEVMSNRSFRSVASSAGVYTLAHLPPGLYTMVVEARGFQRYAREGVHLATGERVRLDVTLLLGNLNQVVTVRANTSMLKTESGAIGQGISHRETVDLPLNGRSFVSLVGLAGGVALSPDSPFPRINGGRPRTNEFLYDGISVLQPEPGTVAFFPVIDAIQEFKVETNSPPAEFGRFNGGVINLTTKSGTNELHGTVFEFLRNEALNARNVFAPAGSKKPLFRRNQFGFVLGGPIRRDRTFFFGDYQGTRQLIGRVRISTVPTLLQRQGIFSEPVSASVPKVFDPDSTATLPGGGFSRAPFPGNIIPASRMDPVALLLLQRYPLPTSPGTSNNFTRVGTEQENQDQFDMRIDHRFSDHDQVFGRYSYAKDFTDPVTPLPDGSGNISFGAIGPTRIVGQSIATRYLHVLNSTLANELRFGYTRRSVNRVALLLDAPPSQALKLSGIPANAAFRNELPTFVITGFQQLGPPRDTDSDFRTDVTEIGDTVSQQLGRHSLKAGFDLRWERLDIIEPPSPTGLFRFSSLFTDLPGVPGTGNALASFLLGQVQDFSIDLQQKVIRPRAHFQEFFVQDDWKTTRRITVNAGLRYTLNFPSTEADNQGAVFNLRTQQFDFLGRDGFPRSARELHNLDFGPRLGLAYRLTDKTVVRSGYGLIWIEMAGITTPFINPQFPFLQTVAQRTLDNINPAFILTDGPAVALLPLTPDAGLGQGVFSVDRGLGSGYAQQWNFAIQRELTPNLSVEIAYTGSKITHVGIPDTNLNQLTADQLRLGPALLQVVPNPFFGQIPQSSSLGGPTVSQAQLLKPFPRFTTVSLFRNNVGNTSYNALQVTLEKRFSRGFLFRLSYTHSKLIDDASSVFSASVLTGPVANFPVADSFNRKLERDVSNGDIPNNFVASYVYELPFGQGRRFNPSGLVGRFLAGWEVAGVIALQSGLPLAVSQATNFNSFAGFGTQRPNRLFNPNLPGARRSTAQWFSTNAFQMAPPFTLGNSSRNPVRGPGFRDADISLIKRTALREQVNLEFRAEIFNLTSTPPLGPPNTIVGTPGFGSITSAGDPRVIQFALKVNF